MPVTRLPIVKLFIEGDEFDEETGKEQHYFADKRLRQYRSVDGKQPLIINEFELDLPMDDMIKQYRVTEV